MADATYFEERFLAASLLRHEEEPRLLPSLGRIATGAALAATYGLALGAREGGAALFTHAIGVPAAVALITAVGVPALYVGLGFFNVPIHKATMLDVVARAWGAVGLVLAGLAPTLALYAVTTDAAEPVRVLGALGLAVGGLAGLKQAIDALAPSLDRADSATRTAGMGVCLVFGLFAVAMAARVWLEVLPIFGGGA